MILSAGQFPTAGWQNMAGWCNGNIPASSVGAFGSNPNPAPRPKGLFPLSLKLKKGELLTTTTLIDVSALTTALSTSVTSGDIVTLIATVVGAGMGLVLVWFGSRKLLSGFMGALKKGKLRI